MTIRRGEWVGWGERTHDIGSEVRGRHGTVGRATERGPIDENTDARSPPANITTAVRHKQIETLNPPPTVSDLQRCAQIVCRGPRSRHTDTTPLREKSKPQHHMSRGPTRRGTCSVPAQGRAREATKCRTHVNDHGRARQTCRTQPETQVPTQSHENKKGHITDPNCRSRSSLSSGVTHARSISICLCTDVGAQEVREHRSVGVEEAGHHHTMGGARPVERTGRQTSVDESAGRG